MTVLVTGATGGAGSWIVDDLASRGREVVGVDLDRPSTTPENVTFLRADLTDQGQCWEVIHEIEPEAVVHFAAIPTNGLRSGGETFLTNVESSYHVFQAAGRLGADIVWASSESVYGSVFAEEPWLPETFPIHEDHPRRPEDPYATSKLVGEELAAATARKYDVSVTSIRPSWITYPGDERMASARESFDPNTAEPNGNFWSYVDVRDAASIVRAALAAEVDGHEAFLAVAEENFLDRPTADVIEATFGELPDDCDLSGDESAFSTAKARDRLGWEPAYSWRETENEAVDGPSFS